MLSKNYPEIYKNAPLVEAIFEIRFKAKFEIENLKHAFINKIKKEFPNVLIPPPDLTEALLLKPIKFEREDKSEAILFSLRQFNYSCRKYQGFRIFKEHALKYIKKFISTYKIEDSDLLRAGLRYINFIPFQREKGVIPLQNYLNFTFNFPNRPKEIEILNFESLLQLKDAKLMLKITSGKSAKDLNEIIALDFDYSIERNLNIAKIDEYLDSSHKATKIIFENILAANYFTFIKGE